MTSLSFVQTLADTDRASFVPAFVKRLAKALADRRTISELSSLDDRLLADIGLIRSRIRDAVVMGRRC